MSRALPTPLVIPVLLLLGLSLPGAGVASEFRSPVTLSAATTVDAGVSNPQIRLDDDPLAGFIVDVIPGGATFRAQFNGELVVQWDSLSVVAGQPFDATIEFESAVASGEGLIDAAYTLVPSFVINYTELFSEWPYEPPLSGSREEQFPLTEGLIRSRALRSISYDDGSGRPPFLLGDVHGLAIEPADTVDMRFDLEIYPCVRLKVVARAVTRLGFEYGTDEFCLRYANAEDDTLCWRATTGFVCRTSPGTWSVTDTVECASVLEHIAPICPMYASGQLSVELTTEVTVDTLEVSYSCTTPSLVRAASPSPASLGWIDQTVDFTSDRNHVIFTIPTVPPERPGVEIRDQSSNPVTALSVGNEYTISWDPIDTDLTACCPGDSLRIHVRDMTIIDPAGDPCGATIASSLADEAPREAQWIVPDLACFDGRAFRIFLEFFCPPATDLQFLERTWSEDLTIEGGSE